MFICESGLLFMTTPGAHDTAVKTLLNEGNNTIREQFMHVLVPVGDPSAFKVTSLQGYFPVALHVPITVVPLEVMVRVSLSPRHCLLLNE